MGWYDDHIVPRAMNVVMDNPAMRRNRALVCADLAGDVLEIGFGTGLNLPHYPAAVTRLRGVEPSALAVRLSESRREASPVSVEVIGLDGQSLGLADDEVDQVLSTWTLCTIPDAARALAEIRRVLRPGGTFHFVEHGRAPDERVRRWQRRIEPIQRRVAGGCHLTRPIADLIAGAGFEIVDLRTRYERGSPKPWGYEYLGTARPV